MVLGGEDVARRPAHIRAELDQRLDEDGGLDRHVEGARDPSALQGKLAGVLLAERHEARHLLLGDADLLAAEVGLGEVAHVEVGHDRALRGDSGHVVVGGWRPGASGLRGTPADKVEGQRDVSMGSGRATFRIGGSFGPRLRAITILERFDDDIDEPRPSEGLLGGGGLETQVAIPEVLMHPRFVVGHELDDAERPAGLQDP